MKLEIDADSLIYKAGCSNETRSYHIQNIKTGAVVHEVQYKADALEYIAGDPNLVPVFHKDAGPVQHSLSNVKRGIEGILDSLRHTDFGLYIGGKGNFRHDLYSEYKAHRDPNAKPIHEKEIRWYMQDTWGAVQVHGEEADDKVSYLCCAAPEDTTIVGIDKDLWNTPGLHYNPDKKIHEYISVQEADTNFWLQMLTGDSADNIPGLKGVGPKTAEKLLDYDNPYESVLQEYRKREQTEDYFILMGRLLWLRRNPGELWDLEIMYG